MRPTSFALWSSGRRGVLDGSRGYLVVWEGGYGYDEWLVNMMRDVMGDYTPTSQLWFILIFIIQMILNHANTISKSRANCVWPEQPLARKERMRAKNVLTQLPPIDQSTKIYIYTHAPTHQSTNPPILHHTHSPHTYSYQPTNTSLLTIPPHDSILRYIRSIHSRDEAAAAASTALFLTLTISHSNSLRARSSDVMNKPPMRPSRTPTAKPNVATNMRMKAM